MPYTVSEEEEDMFVKDGTDEIFSQEEGRPDGQPFDETDRKLHSLLELGQIIGLDLQIDEMLLQIARKAAQMMNADRFSLFLYDAATNELSTTVALGMEKEKFRIPLQRA